MKIDIEYKRDKNKKTKKQIVIGKLEEELEVEIKMGSHEGKLTRKIYGSSIEMIADTRDKKTKMEMAYINVKYIGFDSGFEGNPIKKGRKIYDKYFLIRIGFKVYAYNLRGKRIK